MLRAILSAVAIFAAIVVSAQKTRKVSAEYIYYAPETMTLEEAKREALNRAQIEAIADEFGTFVSNRTSLLRTTSDEQTTTQMVTLTGSDVKGEWLETIGQPVYDINYEERHIVVTVKVKGIVRGIISDKIEVVASTLKNGAERRFADTEFHVGDDLFLYFKSPVDGYLTVFLLDESTDASYCIFPYSTSGGDPVAVKGDTEYVLFSEQHNRFPRMTVDEYTLTLSDNKTEYNIVYILFCPAKFTKAAFESAEAGTTPKNLSVKTFHKWLANTRKRLPDMNVTEIPITILPAAD